MAQKKWAQLSESGLGGEELCGLVDREDQAFSIRDQCELLSLIRSTYYYTSVTETEANLALMRLIDRQYLETPFYGSRRMREWLLVQGYVVNRKRVQRLMQMMGLEAIYPKRHTSWSSPEHRKYPYLLRGLQVDRPNQVWASDLTFFNRERLHQSLGYATPWDVYRGKVIFPGPDARR